MLLVTNYGYSTTLTNTVTGEVHRFKNDSSANYFLGRSNTYIQNRKDVGSTNALSNEKIIYRIGEEPK